MICFLTSSPFALETEALNPANNLIYELKLRFPSKCSALFICSDPKSHERTDFFAYALKDSFEKAGFQFYEFQILDSRNEDVAAKLVKKADFIILAGGHVPTQNKFFNKIGLKEALKSFKGIVFGISAGSMNGADIVYAQPEIEGETLSLEYKRFLPGLGLTKTMLLPHYQFVKDEVLDGLRVIEDITFADSKGRTLFAIPDGTYLFIENGREELRGEAYMIKDEEIVQVSKDGDVFEICN